MKKKIFFTVAFAILCLNGFSQTKEEIAKIFADLIIEETKGTDITDEDNLKNKMIMCQLSDTYDLDRVKSSLDSLGAKYSDIISVSQWQYNLENDYHWSNYIVADFLLKLVYSEKAKLIAICWE